MGAAQVRVQLRDQVAKRGDGDGDRAGWGCSMVQHHHGAGTSPRTCYGVVEGPLRADRPWVQLWGRWSCRSPITQQPPPNKTQRGKRSWFWRVQVSWGQSFDTGSCLIFIYLFIIFW